MNWYLYFFAILSALQSGPVYAMSKTSNPRDEVIPLIKKYSEQLRKEKNVKLRSYGVRCTGRDKVYDGKIHLIDLGYSVDLNIRCDEGRRYFYKIVDGLLALLNSREEFRNCFYHFPITYEDLSFRLHFDYDEKRHLRKDDLEMIAIYENEIMYFIAEEDGVCPKEERKYVTPDVYIITDILSKVKCIRKKLPETEH